MTDSSLNPTGGEHRILVVCSDPAGSAHLRSVLESRGFRVDVAPGVEDAQKRIVALGPSVVLADIPGAPDENRMEDRRQLVAQAVEAGASVVVLAEADQFGAAADLLERGAADCVSKPLSADDLLRRVAIVLLKQKVARGRQRDPGPATAAQGPAPSVRSGRGVEVRRSQAEPALGLPTDMIVGRSATIRKVIDQVRMVAPTQTSVLITGETGTGKERVAQAIHALSLRHKQAMVSVNCGGIPASLLEDEFFGHVKGAFTDAHQARVGRFEQAHGSNIFLDEIGDLPLELQPKLLRVLQEREIHRIGGVETIRVDARVIAATNVDLWAEVIEGRFREDLFYRINVFPIHLPPLRDRREDIPLFIEYFLERFCRRDGLPKKELHPRAEAAVMSRPWPGNIRELENAVEIAVIRSQDRKVVDIEDFPEPRHLSTAVRRQEDAGESADFKTIVSHFERDLIQRVLERTHGNKTRAADLLQLKRTTLIEKLKKLRQLETQEPRGWPAAEKPPVIQEEVL